MFLSILKDSVILFLLIYAVLQLAESLLQFLLRRLSVKKSEKRIFYVLNTLGMTPDRLEGLVRSCAAAKQEEILLITNGKDKETAALVALLCKEFEQLTPISPETLPAFFTEETALDISAEAR